MYDLLLDDQENLVPPAGAEAPVPGGVDIRTVMPDAPTPTGVPEQKTKVNEAGQTVIDDTAVDPNTGMPESAPLTGGQAVAQNGRTDIPIVDDDSVMNQNILQAYGRGGGAAGGGSAGPSWFHDAKLRDKKVGKNSYTLLDEKTWAPPEENRLGKGLSSMLAGMATAGSRVALEDKNRPLAMRMKDAKRVALGEGVANLAGTFLDRKNLRYQDLLTAAGKESEIAKNMAAGRAGGGGLSDQMKALLGVENLKQRQVAAARLENGQNIKAADDLINANPKDPKAVAFRQALINGSNGWLTYQDVPELSFDQLVKSKDAFEQTARQRYDSHMTQVRAKLDSVKTNSAADRKMMEQYIKEQREFANRQRDYFLPENMFWKNGVPPTDKTQYEDVKKTIASSEQLLTGISVLMDVQKKLQQYGPVAGAGGAVIRQFGRFMGMPEAQALANLGSQWAQQIRNILRVENHFGVPSQWEAKLFEHLVLDPGSLMAWLQGDSNFQALYKMVKTNGKLWLRHHGNVGFATEDKPPTGAESYGKAPPLMYEPVDVGPDGKPTWSEEWIEDINKDYYKQIKKMADYGHSLPTRGNDEPDPDDPERGRAPAARESEAEAKMPTGSKEEMLRLQAANKTELGSPVPLAAKPDGPPNDPATGEGTPEFKEFRQFVDTVREGKARWSPKARESWISVAKRTGDRVLSAFANLPYDQQVKLFSSDEPFTVMGSEPPTVQFGEHGNQPAPEAAPRTQSRPINPGIGRKPVDVKAGDENVKPKTDAPRKWVAVVNGQTVPIPGTITKKQAMEFNTKHLRKKDPKSEVKEAP
jgi:hypothetical protein